MWIGGFSFFFFVHGSARVRHRLPVSQSGVNSTRLNERGIENLEIVYCMYFLKDSDGLRHQSYSHAAGLTRRESYKMHFFFSLSPYLITRALYQIQIHRTNIGPQNCPLSTE